MQRRESGGLSSSENPIIDWLVSYSNKPTSRRSELTLGQLRQLSHGKASKLPLQSAKKLDTYNWLVVYPAG